MLSSSKNNIWEAAAKTNVGYFIKEFNIKSVDFKNKSEQHKKIFFKRIMSKDQKYNLPNVTFNNKEDSDMAKKKIGRANRFGMCPFHTALFYNKFESVKLFVAIDHSLLNRPIQHTSSLWTYPLHLAIISGHKKIFKFILKEGSDPFMKDSLGQNAWDVCRTTLQKKFWLELNKWCEQKHYQVLEKKLDVKEPLLLSIKSCKDDLSLIKKNPQKLRMVRSLEDLRIEKNKKQVIPHGPWDFEGCFIKNAPGSCPETNEGMKEDSSETISTITGMTNLNTSISSFSQH